MSLSTVILSQILVMFVAAKGAGELSERLRFPAVIAELAVGMLLGQHGLGWVGAGDPPTLGAAGNGF